MTARHPLFHVAPRLARLAPLAALVIAAGCSAPAGSNPVVNGQPVIPIDPNRPGDTLFQSALDAYAKALAEQVAATTARLAGDPATAATQDALAVADYGTARGRFDLLTGDPTLCPAISIRCDNAGYLGGRCSYEIGIINNDQAALTDAVTRLDAMLSAFPASAFLDAGDYFDGRAHFELTRRFMVGSYTDAELLFERAYAANPGGTWADNSVYWDGRSEYELGYGLINVAVAPAAGSADYLAARAWFDQAISVLGSFASRFPTSSYIDNAAYYLGRAWYEKPTPGTVPPPDTERVANLTTSIAILGSVIGMTSPFVPGAHYWRGRGHYDFSFQRTVAADATADLDAALLDFHAVVATSPWQPHALEWAVKSWIQKADKTSACSEYSAMALAYPLPNVYTTNAQAALTAYLTANSLTCP